MNRLLILLLGLAVGAVLVVVLIPMAPPSDDQRQSEETSPSISLVVEGASVDQYGINEPDTVDLNQMAQRMPPRAAITNPNRSDLGTLKSPAGTLHKAVQEATPKIYIADANGGVPFALAEPPMALLSQNRSGPQIGQSDSARLEGLRPPQPSVQSASNQVQARPIVSNANSAHLVRTHRPDGLRQSVEESSSGEAP